MKVFIFTIPKAGTYFLAALVEQMGFRNTGFHVNKNSRLNTLKFDLGTNAKTPSVASENVKFLPTLAEVKDGELAFGHFAVPLMAWMLPAYHFICAYRHPRKTLVSEFMDFRFRRDDVPWVSRRTIPDDGQAFTQYLERHGPNHAKIFHRMLAVRVLAVEKNLDGFASERFCFVNFDRLLADHQTIEPIRACLAVDPATDLLALHQTALAAETKTKATELTIDRDKFWSEEAQAAYDRLALEPVVQRMGELGLVF
jgi:hypothetical protein